MKFTVTSTALILGLSTTVALAEGNLNIYNWGEYTSPELIDKFSKTYNVHVTLTDFDSNDTALAKVRQGSSGFDVVVPSQSFIPTYIQEGLLAETNPGQMENAKNLEERWRDPAFDPGRKTTRRGIRMRPSVVTNSPGMAENTAIGEYATLWRSKGL